MNNQQTQGQTGQTSALFGGDSQPKYGTPKSSVPEQIRDWDRFVVVGFVQGKPQVITSEQDDRQTVELLHKAMPALAGLENAR